MEGITITPMSYRVEGKRSEFRYSITELYGVPLMHGIILIKGLDYIGGGRFAYTRIEIDGVSVFANGKYERESLTIGEAGAEVAEEAINYIANHYSIPYSSQIGESIKYLI